MQADASRPNLKGLAAALAFVEREIANCRRAIAQGDFASQESEFMEYRADPRFDETISDRGNLLLPEEGNHVSIMVPGGADRQLSKTSYPEGPPAEEAKHW